MTISTTTLKNAAFAIECDLWTDSDGANYLAKDGAILRRWEPEHDDGDAFRLAVALGLSIDLSDPDREEVRILEMNGNHLTVFTEDDSYAAVRQAIILAASRIGATIYSPENN
jgi:hypothetical protein